MTPVPPAATLYAAVVEAVAVSETEIEIEEVSCDGAGDRSTMDDRTAAMFDDPPVRLCSPKAGRGRLDVVTLFRCSSREHPLCPLAWG